MPVSKIEYPADVNPFSEQMELRTLKQLIERHEWEAEYDYNIRLGWRKLHADAVLLYQGRIVAVVEAISEEKLRMREEAEDAVPGQLKLLASLLGASIALVTTEQRILEFQLGTGQFLYLSSFPTIAQIRQQIAGWFGRQVDQLCLDVSNTVSTWQGGGGSRIACPCAGALNYYHDEFKQICSQPQAPLTQCILIGGMYESVLRDVLDALRVPVPPRATLGRLIRVAEAASLLNPLTTSMQPQLIANNRNALHPDAFVSHPGVAHGIAANSAAAFDQAVMHLNGLV